MITSVLVANRGEIARRVFRSCARLGIATVAVYSDADADAPHVHEADAAVRLPGSAPAGTYLRADLLVRAARAAGADAVHPGYGFLSENAGFARTVAEAGPVWIGPPAEAIEAMADKIRAKRLMADAGVPLLAPVPVDEVAGTPADRLPLLVKAAAGGGGRGMRIVREPGALEGELAAARAEAEAAFGDGAVFVEPYVERARHVEVQILADAHGTVWALGTRDCSLQRRHQKVVEEAPAPGLGPELRARLEEFAARAARAIGYRGAGTVEFLVAAGSAEPQPYFLEMNTRLQVEHPVTEAVYGLDLVAEQIRVAEGGALDPHGPPRPYGHAVEARLYAEDPARGWQPQTGTLHRLHLPGAPGEFGPPDGRTGRPDEPGAGLSPASPAGARPYDGPYAGSYAGPYIRLDSGVADGDEITAHYDPLLAKVVAWAPSRAEAVRALAHTLERARVHGPATNRDVLVRSLRHPDFAEPAPAGGGSGRRGRSGLDTGFYDRLLPELAAHSEEFERFRRIAAFAAALADATAAARGGATTGARLGGWRNVPALPHTRTYRSEPDGAEVEVRYRYGRDGTFTAEDAAGEYGALRVLRAEPARTVLEVDGVRREFAVARYPLGDGEVRVHVDGPPPLGAHAFTALPRLRAPRAETEPGSLLAPMPGTVVRLADGLSAGAAVEAGRPLLWLEAMKMEHRIDAPATGTVTALHAEPGRQVEVGTVLAVITEPGADDGQFGAAYEEPGAEGGEPGAAAEPAAVPGPEARPQHPAPAPEFTRPPST